VVERPAPGLDVIVARPLLSAVECQTLLHIACDDIGFTFWASACGDAADTADGAAADDAAASAAAEEKAPCAEDGSDDDGVMLPGERRYTATDVKQRTKTAHGAGASLENGVEAAGNAAVAALDRAFRSADTIEADLPQLAGLLYRRLAHVLPQVLVHTDADAAADSDAAAACAAAVAAAEAAGQRVLAQEGLRDTVGRWVPVGLAPNLLFARYTEGGHFAPHVDGSTISDFNLRSFYTVLLYLNTCEQGGETHIMTGDQRDVLVKDDVSGRIQGSGANRVYSMKPEEGAAIVFGAEVLHEGSAVAPPSTVTVPSAEPGGAPTTVTVEHRKFIVRGDVLYRRDPPLLDDPTDREAFAVYQAARVAEADGDTERALGLFRRVRRLSPGLADVYQL